MRGGRRRDREARACDLLAPPIVDIDDAITRVDGVDERMKRR
jgi:hypothetical protein